MSATLGAGGSGTVLVVGDPVITFGDVGGRAGADAGADAGAADAPTAVGITGVVGVAGGGKRAEAAESVIASGEDGTALAKGCGGAVCLVVIVAIAGWDA